MKNKNRVGLFFALASLSLVYGGLSEEKGYYRLEFDIEEVENE